MKFLKNKYLILILSGFVGLNNNVYANGSENQNKQVENTVEIKKVEQKTNTPDLNLTLRKNLNSEYEALSAKMGVLQEKIEKEKYILSSVNQNVLFLSNMVVNGGLKIATPFYQKSITYVLKVNLKEKELYFDPIFVSDTLRNKDYFSIPFNCDDSCEYEYEILLLDGNKKMGKLLLEKTEDVSKLKINERSLVNLLNELEFAELLSISVKNTFFQEDIFNFYLK